MGHFDIIQKHMMSNNLIKRIPYNKEKKSFKVVILGTRSVGKSALTVRIKTRKFIHTYAPNIESKYTFPTSLDGDNVLLDVIDTAALQTEEGAGVEQKIKWADAFILLYSITDTASLEALTASKFLINVYAKRRRKSLNSAHSDLLVALVGNKRDLEHDRQVSEDMGRLFAEAHECTHFFEISARESFESVQTVFESLYRVHKTCSPITRLRSPEIIDTEKPVSEDQLRENYQRISAQTRGRTRATSAILLPALVDSPQVSPVVLRKKFDSSASDQPPEASDQTDINFIGAEFIYQQKSPLPTRRITMHNSPLLKRRNQFLVKRLKSLEHKLEHTIREQVVE